MAGFMRSADGGPAWSYLDTAVYAMEYVTDKGPMNGWMAVTLRGERVAVVADHALATTLRDILNRGAVLATRPTPRDDASDDSGKGGGNDGR